MAKLLDDLSKNLAGGMTRRRAIATFAAGVAGVFALRSRTGEADAYYSSDACANFCYNTYGYSVQVAETCYQRCQNLYSVNGTYSMNGRYSVNGTVFGGLCPPGSVPVKLNGSRVGGDSPLDAFNPFPDAFSHAYILCVPFRINSSFIVPGIVRGTRAE